MQNEQMIGAITAAIGAHWMWKARLKAAIASKRLDTPLATLVQDDQCVFGKWLYGNEVPSEHRAGAQYHKVRDLHARFHRAVGDVAENVLRGHAREANELMDVGSYFTVSAELTQALLEWKGELSSVHA